MHGLVRAWRYTLHMHIDLFKVSTTMFFMHVFTDSNGIKATTTYK